MRNVLILLAILATYLLVGGFLGWWTAFSRTRFVPLHWGYALMLPAVFLVGYVAGVLIRFFGK